MIQIGVRQQHALNRRMAGFFNRGMERRETFDLRANVRRCVQEKPALVIGADRHRGLCPGPNAPGGRAGLAADGAIAIPLRHAAAGGGAEQVYLHWSILLRAMNQGQSISHPRFSCFQRKNYGFSSFYVETDVPKARIAADS